MHQKMILQGSVAPQMLLFPNENISSEIFQFQTKVKPSAQHRLRSPSSFSSAVFAPPSRDDDQGNLSIYSHAPAVSAAGCES